MKLMWLPAAPLSGSLNEISRSANALKMSSMDHFPAAERCIVQFMKTTELTSKQILSVPCTTCGAAIGEACETAYGTAPHRATPRSEIYRSRRRRNDDDGRQSELPSYANYRGAETGGHSAGIVAKWAAVPGVIA